MFSLILGAAVMFEAAPGLASTEAIPLHLDPEMQGHEYQALFQERGSQYSGPLDPVIQAGERNLNWLRAINAARPAGMKIAFFSRADQKGVPPETPGKNNESIVLAKFASLSRDLPEAMRKVILEGGELTAQLPVDQATYIRWGRAVDIAYQGAARWVAQLPYLKTYEAYRQKDIRGWLFLSREKDLDTKLEQWDQLPDTEKARLKPWIIGLCVNSRPDLAACTKEYEDRASTPGFVLSYYRRYAERAFQIYELFFRIVRPRREAVWKSSDPTHFYFPFLDPGTPELRSFLKDNIEDEWRLGDWSLQVKFDTQEADRARLVLVPGASPNTNRVGGEVITLDANQPLDLYSSQWAIRHEFGHVLGFQDCYVEFYDAAEGVMVDYQIDTDNLMCSRKGRFLGSHFEELHRVYHRN